MKRVFRSLFLLGIMFYIFSGGYVITCIDTAMKESYFNKTAYHTIAQVTKVQASKGGYLPFDWNKEYMDPNLAQVDYTYNGVEYSERLLNCEKLMNVGDYIRICISPDDPTHIRAEHNPQTPTRLGWITLLTLAGTACIFPTISENMKKKKEEKQQADEIIETAMIINRKDC